MAQKLPKDIIPFGATEHKNPGQGKSLQAFGQNDDN